MLLSTIKVDLSSRISDAYPKAVDESAEPLIIGDTSSFEVELEKELQKANTFTKLPRRHFSLENVPRQMQYIPDGPTVREQDDTQSTENQDISQTQDKSQTQFDIDNVDACDADNGEETQDLDAIFF